jgi:hypothetical protein
MICCKIKDRIDTIENLKEREEVLFLIEKILENNSFTIHTKEGNLSELLINRSEVEIQNNEFLSILLKIKNDMICIDNKKILMTKFIYFFTGIEIESKELKTSEIEIIISLLEWLY